MKLNVYKNQNEVEKTYEVEKYDIMYGTVQDILELLDDGIEDMKDENQLIKLVAQNRTMIDNLLMDIFAGLTEEELRRTKVNEIIPMFFELFAYVQNSFKSKN